MAHKLQCVITDLDGSIINPNLEPAEEDIHTIQVLKKQHVEVFVATGRHPFNTEQMLHTLDCNMTAACINGGHVYNFENHFSIATYIISSDKAKEIFDYLNWRAIHYSVYTSNNMYFSNGNPHLDFYERYYSLCESQYQYPICFLGEEFFIEQHEVIKFMIPHQDQNFLDELRHTLCVDGTVQAFFSGYDCIDINSAGVSKATGVRRLLAGRGINLENTLIMGDESNDVSMLSICGYPVIPSNGSITSCVPNAYITTSNQNSPLTNAIKALFPEYLSE